MVNKWLEKTQRLAQEKSLKVLEEDSILTKIQKILLGLSMQLLLMLVQQLEKLRMLISLSLEKFKFLLSWSKGLRFLVKKNKQRLLKGLKNLYGGKEKDDHTYKVLNVVNEYYKERINQMPKEWQDLLTSESASQLSAKIPDLPLNVEPLTLKSLTAAYYKYIDNLKADNQDEYAKEHERVLKDNPNLIKDWWNSVTNKEYIPWEV